MRHSDKGAQYLSIRYSEWLAEAGIEPAVGSKGDSYDNALAETINGLYKAEVIHRRGPWKTKQAVELATLEWVARFNHHRLMGPLGHVLQPNSKPITIDNALVRPRPSDLNKMASAKAGVIQSPNVWNAKQGALWLMVFDRIHGRPA